mgnify:CR=1 FL=1
MNILVLNGPNLNLLGLREPELYGREDYAALCALINATAEELDTLPGIGESLARRIIAYREANGPFGSIEEIMEVSGIGEAKFAELEDRVTVDNGKGEVTNEDSGG